MIKIFEEFVGQILNPLDYYIKYDIYKNPKFLRNISSDCRGIIDENGNLFIADSENIIHYDLYNSLLKMNFLQYKVKNIYKYPKLYVPVQRYKNTNDFFLGEGYSIIFDYEYDFIDINIDDFFNNIQLLLNRAKQKNPRINFHVETITDITFKK